MHQIVVDLSFGDAGKGTTVDWLCSQQKPVHAVVRFNGGAQAAHNVVTISGRHHTFSQFGSGTLAGVPTFLSADVLVDPLRLANEAARLKKAHGIANPFDMITLDERSLITTPYHAAYTRLRELARGLSRHGSTGVGIAGTVEYDAHSNGPRLSHIADGTLADRLQRLRQWVASGPAAAFNHPSKLLVEAMPSVDELVDAYEQIAKVVDIDTGEKLAQAIYDDRDLVWEGAQGVLLDQWWGFHPYTTWSNTTPENAVNELVDMGIERDQWKTIGVLRSYTTRHGPGPLPTELKATPVEKHNGTGEWMGAFRAGTFDRVAHQYAIDACDAVGGVDELAITHLDVCLEDGGQRGQAVTNNYYDGHATPQIYDHIRVDGVAPGANRPVSKGASTAFDVQKKYDLIGRERLTRQLMAASAGGTSTFFTYESFVSAVTALLGLPVTIRSFGPSAAEKFGPLP